ncbi:MAG: outer membrane lipoprotein carrier protein LolA [Verrucomicrobia bacterium]|nr:outer membrane lipoprotein carrier protein LolA [Verrucomicrobiota bacterium]
MNLQTPNTDQFYVRIFRIGTWCLKFLWSLVLGAWCFRVAAVDTNAVVTGWLAAQTNLHTWEADFIQTRTLKTLTKPLFATGHLRFATPNRFRWELLTPSQTIAMRDADEMWVIYPLLKRAERYPLNTKTSGEWRDALSLLEAGFPRDRAEFDSQFRLLSLTETNGSWQLGLQPASAFARKMMREITVGLATNDFALTSTEMTFIDGSRMRNDFTNAVMNPNFDQKVFQWIPDADFKITEPLGR